ncbi:MAG: sugar transferase [Desulfobacteraceae bacterium]|nr:sugar transferase [Desulfobacteraceae bacterium]
MRAKRLFDLLAGSALFFLASPLLVMISLLIRTYMGKPVFFKQLRPGYKAKPFYMIKFRTMGEYFDANGGLLPDAERLTRLGRFLRSSSLDELPGLFNVIKGSMSLVGPRPLLMQYLDRYTLEQARRHDVKPGLTGWAQVNGRNAISWEEKFKLDIWYVDNACLWADIMIILQTLKKVFQRDGISHPGEATMAEFNP